MSYERIMVIGMSILACAGAAIGQPIGQTSIPGGTWWDNQSFGTQPRAIAEDEYRNKHTAWSYRADSAGWPTRHVLYSGWNEDRQVWGPGNGFGIDYASHAGHAQVWYTAPFCPIITYDGAYGPHTVSTNLLCLEVTDGPVPPRHWDFVEDVTNPRSCVDMIGNLHLFATTTPDIETIWLWYARGQILRNARHQVVRVDWDVYADSLEYQDFGQIDQPCYAMAAARHAPRVARAWPRPTGSTPYRYGFDQDLVIQISEDGGASWSDTINVTSFVPPDTACSSGHFAECNRDTFRFWRDISLLFDEHDQLHISFVTSRLSFWDNGEFSLNTNGLTSMIWHWSEATHQVSFMVNGWSFYSRELGDYWDRVVQRPCLSVDESTGRLYCLYQTFDTTAQNVNHYCSADLFCSVSTDEGVRWSVGTNVTRTHPAGNPVPNGQSLLERDPSATEVVSSGLLHVQYELDHEAGDANEQSLPLTWNEIIYQRIPVDSIPTTPLMPQYPLHWDSTGFYAAAQERAHPTAAEFALVAPYPNPFNSTATIEYSLALRASVRLAIYDILGREVAVLVDDETNAGSHRHTWDARGVASGLYFVSLRSGDQAQTRKLMLLK
ncbi:T9SS type A sorting domain-containing protein [candidate division KSB1 bacterium]|nr:T9SS type A sorting domain-containing protein [candidate division KSB1 bacterium]